MEVKKYLNKKNIFVIVIVFLLIAFITTHLPIFFDYKIKIYTKRHDYDKVENLYKNKKRLLEIVFKNDKESLSKTIKNFISFYNEQGLYDKSNNLYAELFAIDFNTRNKDAKSAFYDNNLLLMAKEHSELGDVNKNQKQYEEAEKNYNKAIKLKKDFSNKNFYVSGKNFHINSELWKEYNKLGILKTHEKNYKEAQDYFKLANKIYMLENEQPSWEISYNIALLQIETGNLKSAQRTIESYIIMPPTKINYVKMQKSEINNNSFIVTKMKYEDRFREDLAYIYVKEKNTKQAIQLLNDIKKDYIHLYGENSPEIYCIRYKLKEIYESENNISKYNIEKIELSKMKTLLQREININPNIELEYICKII